ncbi:hypothetical protein LIER_37434 [Lithospermum erythrorhizon]|uniref:Uncharacterized protein n=1 Tax=Lithospermum erythrorhizon TaxID=34254 RepID=A0AAV3PMC0_LITER
MVRVLVDMVMCNDEWMLKFKTSKVDMPSDVWNEPVDGDGMDVVHSKLKKMRHKLRVLNKESYFDICERLVDLWFVSRGWSKHRLRYGCINALNEAKKIEDEYKVLDETNNVLNGIIKDAINSEDQYDNFSGTDGYVLSL